MSRTPIDVDIHNLTRQFPDRKISISSITENGDYAVLFMQAKNGSGAFYIFDRKTRKITKLPDQYPGLNEDALGQTIATSYEARNGLNIPAFITLPPSMLSLDAVTSIPFVVLPHGGPAARDFLRFDYWLQFLATRGYDVLQMNFRGSAGHGQSFVDAGNREWGQAMQDDITDGVHWLVENG